MLLQNAFHSIKGRKILDKHSHGRKKMERVFKLSNAERRLEKNRVCLRVVCGGKVCRVVVKVLRKRKY